MTTQTSSTLEAALHYASLGLPVYPVHRYTDASCTVCATPQEKCPWWHPGAPGHLADLPGTDAPLDGPLPDGIGSTDLDEVRRAWEDAPHAHIAVELGASFAMLEILPPRTTKPSPWDDAWEFTESVADVRERLDYILGPVGVVSFPTPDGGEAYVYASPEPVASWSLRRARVRGGASWADDVPLLPSSLAGWSDGAPSVVPPAPERLVAAFADEVDDEDHVILSLDRSAYAKHAGNYSDLVDILRDADAPLSANKVQKVAKGNRQRTLQRLREGALHPDCPIIMRPGPRTGHAEYALT